MNNTQYKKLNDQAKTYFADLDLDKVRAEFCFGPLLNRNLKLEKGSGVPNFGLELVPSKFGQTEFNMCGNEGQCLFTCLVFSGVSNMMKSKTFELSDVLKKRLRRTFLFLKDKEFFLNKLTSEIHSIRALAPQIAVRLNVFSDLDWNNMIDLEQFQNVTMYDYTKKSEHLTKNSKKHFTYSASEKDNDSDLKALLKKGFNVAMVFHTNKLPKTWEGFTVIDGDEHDRRYQDPKGVVVGLKQKSTIGGKHKTEFTR